MDWSSYVCSSDLNSNKDFNARVIALQKSRSSCNCPTSSTCWSRVIAFQKSRSSCNLGTGYYEEVMVIAFQKSRSRCNSRKVDVDMPSVISFKKSRSSCNSPGRFTSLREDLKSYLMGKKLTVG